MDGLRDMGVVLGDEAFPEVDLALRRGRHVDADDVEKFSFLVEYQAELEAFYRRFGCELMRSNDGFFYLLPVSDRFSRRHLSRGEMLVGQALTLIYLDPETLARGRVITREQVLGQLAGTLGTDALVRVFNPKIKKKDERVAEEMVRVKVAEALRRLASLGFVEPVESDHLRLRPALMRFAEPLRALGGAEEALKKLAKDGVIALTSESEPEPDPDADAAADPDADSDATADSDVAGDSELDPDAEDPDEPEAEP